MLQKGFYIKNFLILNFIFSFQLLQAQEVNCNCFVVGKVTDKQTREPIVGALIEISAQKKATFSDKNGDYKIENVCEGKYEMNIRILGYDAQKLEVNLIHENTHNFKLNESEIHLDGINISAKRIESVSGNEKQLDVEQLKKLTGQNLATILNSISGVSIIQTGSSIGKPVIHGMHSNRILTINNGIRHEAQQWGNEHAPEIDPFLAKQITVIKGAKSVRYGPDAIGGVIIIEPNELKHLDRIQTEINQYSMSNGWQNGLSAIVESSTHKIKGLDWRLQASTKKGGDVATPNYKLANTGSQEFNFSIGAKYSRRRTDLNVFFSQFNSKIGIFSGSHIGNTTDLAQAIGRDKPLDIYTPEEFTYKINKPYQDIQHSLLKLKLNQQLRNNQSLQITFGQQYNFRAEVDALRGDRNTAQIFKINTNTLEVLFNHKPFFKNIAGNIGLNGLYQYNISTGNIREPQKSNVLIPNYTNFTMGAFWIERYVKGDFELEAGIRWDKRYLDVFYLKRLQTQVTRDEFNNQSITNTFSVSRNFNNRLKLGYNFATAWKPPVVSELYSDGVHHGSAAYEVGELSLKTEKVLENSFVLNFTSKFYQLEVLAYFNHLNNYIFLAPTGNSILTIRGAFPEFKYTQTDARFAGFDISNTWSKFQRFTISNQLSLLWADDLNRNQPLIFMPANRSETNLTYRFNDFWVNEITLNHRLVFKQNRTPQASIFEKASDSSFLNLINGDYMAAPEGYNLFDVMLSKDFKLKKTNSFKVSLECKNILNTVYRDYLNRFRYFSDEIGRNFSVRTNIIF
ncbi:TonB-dependent receptor [Lacihabitans soyangensis]|uniref:TonB-dependent receptor n=1 Tax=Lacihabitans soyangensis TaxID=869394 RepID=A0AAE3H5S5_9BACT|nr:TonB-dependent receptor plug domain-containing protein [Lacihabitans soyangensis]MCP9764549.1 TonB-dependent receptor [Lacihabitans soyangensis]